MIAIDRRRILDSSNSTVTSPKMTSPKMTSPSMISSKVTSMTSSNRTRSKVTCSKEIKANKASNHRCAFSLPIHKFTKRKAGYFYQLIVSLILLYFLNDNKVNAFQFLDDPVRNSRVHQVRHLIGETALLPCEVRTQECGQVYFITWSRNTSQEWHRIFIYSKTNQKPFYDTYNQLIGRPNRYTNQTQKLSFDAANLTADAFAYLRIESVDNDDEGMFRCDVTYVKGKCPSLTYTQLSTIVKPGKPEIKVNGIEITNNQESSLQETFRLNAGNKHRRLAFEEGSTVTLECSTTGGKPVPFIRMFNGTRPLAGKVALSVDETTSKQRVTSISQFVLSRFDLNSRFYCKVWTNLSSMQPLFEEVSIDVHVKPTKLTIIKPPTPAVVAGEMVSLTCTVDGSRPRSTITWFNRSQPIQQNPVENTELMDDGTYRTSSTLVFIATRFDHESEFFCKGTNDVLKSKNEVPLLQATQLQVLYPPHVWMEPSDSLDVNESQSASILCKWRSNPTNLSELYFTFTPYSDPSNQTPIAGVVSPPFVLTKNVQFSRNAQFSILQNGIAELMLSNLNRNQSGFYGCTTRNAFGRSTAPKPLQINIQFPPVVSIELLPAALSDNGEQGNSLRLRCIVLTGQPRRLLKVHWFRNGNHFASTPNYYFPTNEDINEEINELALNNLTESALQANYSCSGYNGINRFGPISAAKALNQAISSSLHLAFANRNGLIRTMKDSSLKINCTQLISKTNNQNRLKDQQTLTKWWYNDELIDNAEPGSDSLFIEKATLATEGNYTCEQFGDLRASIYLKVQAPPRLIIGLPSFITWPARNRSLTLSCRVECEPKCTINWLINNRTLNSDHRTSIAEIAQAAEGELFASTVSYLRVNDAQLLQPDNQIMCKSDSNAVGDGVQSISVFKTEAPPHSIQTSTELLELLEGQLLSNQLVSCSAIGFPPAYYTWSRQTNSQTNEQQIVVSAGRNVLSATSLLKKSLSQQHSDTSSDQQLNIGLIRASREMTGNYTCKASNKLGESQKQISVLVYYRPECSVRKEMLTNGKILLTCTGVGLPSSLNYSWFKANQSLINQVTIEQQQNGAILVLPETETLDLNQYSCIASNTIGNSDACRLDSGLNQINSQESLLPSFFYRSNYLLVFAITSGILGFLLVCVLIVCTVYFILRKRIKADENVGSKALNLPAGATYGLINSELMARTLNSKFNNYNNTENINYGKTSTLVNNYSEEQCKLALFDDEENKSITDGRSSDYHTYCDADTVRMSSTTKLFHPQTGQLTKYSSNNKIYNTKMSSTSTGHTNSNNSTSPLITRGQQLLLSSNEEDDDEDTQMQLSTKRPSCSSQLTTSSIQTNLMNSNSNFMNSNRSSLTNANLNNNQPYSQNDSQQPNFYYGQVIAPNSTQIQSSQLTAANRFLERQSNYRSQSNLGSFSTLSNKTIEQDHHYYEPMFSSNKIYHQADNLPPIPPERNNQNLTNMNGNFNNGMESSLRSSMNGNFATLHHPQHYLLSNSVQPPHMSNYNTLNLGKHTVISNLTSSSTNLQHLNQFYSKKKLHR